MLAIIWLQKFGSNSPVSELNGDLLPKGSSNQVRCSAQLHPRLSPRSWSTCTAPGGLLGLGVRRAGTSVPQRWGNATDPDEYRGEHLVMLYRDTHSSVGLIFISPLDAVLFPGSSHHSPSPPSLTPLPLSSEAAAPRTWEVASASPGHQGLQLCTTQSNSATGMHKTPWMQERTLGSLCCLFFRARSCFHAGITPRISPPQHPQPSLLCQEKPSLTGTAAAI